MSLDFKSAAEILAHNPTRLSANVGLILRGTQVSYIVPGGSAWQLSDIEEGDSIVSVNGVKVTNTSVSDALKSTNGSQLTIEYRKANGEIKTSAIENRSPQELKVAFTKKSGSPNNAVPMSPITALPTQSPSPSTSTTMTPTIHHEGSSLNNSTINNNNNHQQQAHAAPDFSGAIASSVIEELKCLKNGHMNVVSHVTALIARVEGMEQKLGLLESQMHTVMVEGFKQTNVNLINIQDVLESNAQAHSAMIKNLTQNKASMNDNLSTMLHALHQRMVFIEDRTAKLEAEREAQQQTHEQQQQQQYQQLQQQLQQQQQEQSQQQQKIQQQLQQIYQQLTEPPITSTTTPPSNRSDFLSSLLPALIMLLSLTLHSLLQLNLTVIAGLIVVTVIVVFLIQSTHLFSCRPQSNKNQKTTPTSKSPNKSR